MTCWLCGFETTELVTNANAPRCKNGPCQICIAVGKVDEEINQTVATLRHLLEKRCDLRSEQNRVHGTLIHRLPAELKNYIFELFLPLRDEWGESHEIGRPSKSVKPLYLTSICRNWRDTAWSNPTLWSAMHFAFGTRSTTCSPSSQINFVHDWILRSRTMPLTLHIVVHNSEGEEQLKGVIDAISQCSNKWHSLSIDMSWTLLRAFLHNISQYRLLRRLKLIVRRAWGPEETNDPVTMPLLNPTVSPEKIEIYGISFQSLQISWHLSYAKVHSFDLEEIAQLFKYASQMTHCVISSLKLGVKNFSMPPITHQRLKTLSLCSTRYADELKAVLLGSLTLPCLQEFCACETVLLTPEYLPALVHRSSCLLTRITFMKTFRHVEPNGIQYWEPLPGVTDLVLENTETDLRDAAIVNKVVEKYFPDLRHLTLRPKFFLSLWCRGLIPILLDREGLKILVIDQDRFDDRWNFGIGKQLKAWNISLRGDGFELSGFPELACR